ncbi:hydroxybutyrate dehydrogenase [Apiospora arundinis]
MADKVQQSAPAAAAEKSLGDPPPTDGRGEHDSEKSSNVPQVEPSDAKPTVLITGCSEGGIGAALALQFWERGYHVYATARDVGKIGAPLSGLSDVSLLTLDVTKPEHIREAAAVVERQTGGRGLNVLVNNAGKAHFMPLLDDDLDDVRNTIEVNYVAPLAVTQAFAPSLIRAKGVSVYITSLAGYLNIPYVGQ